MFYITSQNKIEVSTTMTIPSTITEIVAFYQPHKYIFLFNISEKNIMQITLVPSSVLIYYKVQKFSHS